MRRFINFRLVSLLVVLVSLSAGAALPTLTPTLLHALQSRQQPNISQGQRNQPGVVAPLDWPEFHGDVARDGNESSDTLLSKDNAKMLIRVNGSAFTTTGASMTSPSIYHGLLYYATNTPMGNLEVSTMYAVHPLTGQLAWSEPFPPCGSFTKQEYVYSSPAITTGLVNGRPTTEVFIGWGSYSPGAQGCLYTFNGLTGAVIWTYNTQRSIFSSPAIMSTNSGTIVVAGDNADFVHAFSINYNGPNDGTGAPLWTYDTRNDQPPPGYAQYCKTSSEKCGDSIWSSPAEGLVKVNATLHHYAYFGLGAGKNTVGRLDTVDLDTIVNNSPILVWSFWDPHPAYDNDFCTVLVYSDSNGLAVRVFTGMHTGHMFALAPASGAMYFDFSTSAQLGNIQTFIHSTGTLASINGTLELIFGSGCSPDLHYPFCLGRANGNIWAIDALSTASSGTLLWKTPDFGGDIVSSPVTVNAGPNAVVFINGPWYPGTVSRGDLLALDPATGTFLHVYPIYSGYGTVSSPAIYGGRIFVTVGYNLYIQHNPGGGGLAAFRCNVCR